MKPIQDIIKEFDDIFLNKDEPPTLYASDDMVDLLKDFIINRLEARDKEFGEMVEGMKKPHTNNLEHEKDEYWCCPDCLKDSFKNSALDSILSKLTNK